VHLVNNKIIKYFCYTSGWQYKHCWENYTWMSVTCYNFYYYNHISTWWTSDKLYINISYYDMITFTSTFDHATEK